MTSSEWLTLSEAAARVGLTAESLARLVTRGEGPVAYRPSRHLRFRAEDLDAWLDARRVDPEAAEADRIARTIREEPYAP